MVETSSPHSFGAPARKAVRGLKVLIDLLRPPKNNRVCLVLCAVINLVVFVLQLRDPHRPLEASKNIVVASCFSCFRVWLFLLAFMLPLCAQLQAMIAPSGPMDEHTDPQSNPTRPKMAPNWPDTNLQPSPHLLPEASTLMGDDSPKLLNECPNRPPAQPGKTQNGSKRSSK